MLWRQHVHEKMHKGVIHFHPSLPLKSLEERAKVAAKRLHPTPRKLPEGRFDFRRQAADVPASEQPKGELAGGRKDLRVNRCGKTVADSESLEWAKLDTGHKMAMLLLAGVDGDLVDLTKRDWRELPGPERDAIKREVRAAKNAFSRVVALSGRW